MKIKIPFLTRLLEIKEFQLKIENKKIKLLKEIKKAIKEQSNLKIMQDLEDVLQLIS